jgi:F-type H+-transporting ATPase subunit b
VRRAGLAWLLVVAAPSAAFAADGGESGIGHLVWEIVNLALLLGILVYFGRTPVREYFAQRRTAIREGLEGSARLLREAESRMDAWQARLERVEAETSEIAATARRQAELERERILADARAGAERIRRDATAAVEQEVRRARAKLREEASDLAVELAERMLREQVTERDRKRLVEEFVERVEREEAR